MESIAGNVLTRFVPARYLSLTEVGSSATIADSGVQEMTKESSPGSAGPSAGDGTGTNPLPDRDATLYARIIAAQNEIVLLAHDPNQVVNAVIHRASELTRSAGAVVEILDEGKFVYWVASGSAGAQLGLRVPSEGSLSGLCVTRNEVLRCDDAESDPRVNREACRRVGLRSMLVTPLIYEDKPFGVLKVLSPYPRAYRAPDVRAMRMMAALVGAALGHALGYSDLLNEYRDRIEAEHQAEQVKSDRAGRIRALIRDRALAIVYQPIVSLSDGHVFAYEALSRFPPGSPTPDIWFVQAAEVGLGLALELEAVRAALSRLGEIPQPCRLSINASPDTIVSDEFRALLARHDMARVIIEITEHTTVADYERLCACLHDLQARGVMVAIDDAGAGFASLRHILHVSPDIIKLDISLTRGIDSDLRRQTLVSAIQAFASGTNATIVVEGVETERELRALAGLGVEYGQGYYLGRPAPLEAALPSTV
jgi:EAL domain-containing protein (putative c-di-GMP-specific phosphodiesterase class I)